MLGSAVLMNVWGHEMGAFCLRCVCSTYLIKRNVEEAWVLDRADAAGARWEPGSSDARTGPRRLPVRRCIRHAGAGRIRDMCPIREPEIGSPRLCEEL